MVTAVPAPCDEAILAEDGAGSCTDRRATLLATVLGSSLAIVVGTIVNVALPAMQAEFGVDAAGAQWIVNAYLLPVGALVLIGGALGDHYGRKGMFLTGLAVFAIGCAVCAFAPTFAILLLGRAIEGVGAALLAPNSLAIISAAFPRAERGAAIGTWAAAGAIAGALAPVAGGFLVDNASWRWAFGLVVLPALAAMWIGWRGLDDSREHPDEAAPLDWPGASLVTVALGATIWAITAFPDRGIASPAVLAAFAAGMGAFLAFLLVERRKRDGAMMPLSLFASTTFSGISLLTLFLYAALGGLLLLLPYALINVRGMSATMAGAALLPFPLLMGTLSRRAGGLTDKVGVKTMLTVGSLLVAAGFALFALAAAGEFSYWRAVLPGLLVVALGMAASVAPLTTAVMNAVDDDRMGVASGVNNSISRVAGLVATAFLGLVLMSAGTAEGGAGDGAPNEAAFMARYGVAAWIGAGLALLSAAVSFTMIGNAGSDAAGSGTRAA